MGSYCELQNNVVEYSVMLSKNVYICWRHSGRDRFFLGKVSRDFWSQSNIFQSWWELSVCQSNLQFLEFGNIFFLRNTKSDFEFKYKAETIDISLKINDLRANRSNKKTPKPKHEHNDNSDSIPDIVVFAPQIIQFIKDSPQRWIGYHPMDNHPTYTMCSYLSDSD